MKSSKVFARNPKLFAVLVLFILGTGNAMAEHHELTMSGLSDWLDAYGAAWETRDADAAAKIFSADATYQVTPYEEPHVGQEGVHKYWAGVTENQRNVQFEHEAISVTGNTGIAHWSAKFEVAPDGAVIELNGIFVLEFNDDGKVRQLREWWHLNMPGAERQD